MELLVILLLVIVIDVIVHIIRLLLAPMRLQKFKLLLLVYLVQQVIQQAIQQIIMNQTLLKIQQSLPLDLHAMKHVTLKNVIFMVMVV